MSEKEKATASLVPKPTREKKKSFKDNTTAEELSVIDSFRKMVEDGDIEQFVIAGLDSNGEIVIANYVSNLVECFGILELAKYATINQQASQ